MIHPVIAHILAPKFPRVLLLSTANSTSDLTTYTFSAMDIGGLHAAHPFSAEETIPSSMPGPPLASSGRKTILAIIHGEDANATFNVSSVTIGGVAGTERVDRGGGTNAINTAIYSWNPADLAGIANTDVAVTWSEAITSCAVGIVEVSNVRGFGAAGTMSATGTGLITGALSPIGSADQVIGGAVIMGSTCATGGGTELPEFGFNTGALLTGTDSFNPTTLYEGNNAEIDFAAAYYILPTYQYPGATPRRFEPAVSWSGAGAGDAAAVWIV